jgi:hypothetical protein
VIGRHQVEATPSLVVWKRKTALRCWSRAATSREPRPAMTCAVDDSGAEPVPPWNAPGQYRRPSGYRARSPRPSGNPGSLRPGRTAPLSPPSGDRRPAGMTAPLVLGILWR